MTASVRKQGSVAIVELEGKLGIGAAVDDFRATWSDCLSTGCKDIVVILARVPMVDSSGIGSLIRCHSALSAVGGRLKVVGINDTVRQAFKVTRLDTVFDLHDTEASALSSLSS
ncbi:MAG TPA: STAS domain-containing protein [Terriglobales bacterium]|nr:STAS domain-containing protein [Terriglobales bacterium]